MTGFEVGWLMGTVTGSLFGVMATLTYQWWLERKTWRRRDEYDPTIERLRSLSRPTSWSETRTP